MKDGSNKVNLTNRDHRFVMNLQASVEVDLADRATHYERRRKPLEAFEKSLPGLRLYPYSKGLQLVNDGVAYGERLVERRVIIDSSGYTVGEFGSVRTRTGKQPLTIPKTTEDKEHAKP